MSNTNYIKKIIKDYCVLDTETTGLNPRYERVIEVGILRVRDDEIVDRYSQLVNPGKRIDPFITELTGITNRMVADQPVFSDIREEVLAFLSDDIIIGHNTSFDIRFLSAELGEPLCNKYMDTVQFSRKLFPELSNHRLSDMTAYLGLTNNEHRALADCVSTKELYDAIKKKMADKGQTIEHLWVSCKCK